MRNGIQSSLEVVYLGPEVDVLFLKQLMAVPGGGVVNEDWWQEGTGNRGSALLLPLTSAAKTISKHALTSLPPKVGCGAQGLRYGPNMLIFWTALLRGLNDVDDTQATRTVDRRFVPGSPTVGLLSFPVCVTASVSRLRASRLG